MSRAAPIPGVQKVHLPEARQAIPHVHTYLRECILDGTLTPGTKLSQVALAEQLGVSRTPLREVLRMLQEEGLVEIEPNQRTRVAGLDPQELDDVYACRILMETLALSMTMGNFGAAGRKEARGQLAAMRRAARTGDFDQWFGAHAECHRLCRRTGRESSLTAIWARRFSNMGLSAPRMSFETLRAQIGRVASGDDGTPHFKSDAVVEIVDLGRVTHKGGRA